MIASLIELLYTSSLIYRKSFSALKICPPLITSRFKANKVHQDESGSVFLFLSYEDNSIVTVSVFVRLLEQNAAGLIKEKRRDSARHIPVFQLHP